MSLSPNVIEDLLLEGMMHVKSIDAQSSYVVVVWEFGEGSPRAQVSPTSLDRVEDRGFQMLNDYEIVISVQEESDPVDDETHEDEGNNCDKSIRNFITNLLSRLF
ncbi:hypothetical protein TNCV_2007551 [Trichonephila clavipes]|nr:hypothetical protein TNCV_2007551 [Trichonephila clavipes]